MQQIKETVIDCFVLCRYDGSRTTRRKFDTYNDAYDVMHDEFCEMADIYAGYVEKHTRFEDITGIIDDFNAFNAVCDVEWMITKGD